MFQTEWGIIAKGELLEVGKPAELIEKYGAQNLEEVFERVVLDREVYSLFRKELRKCSACKLL